MWKSLREKDPHSPSGFLYKISAQENFGVLGWRIGF